MRFWVIKAKSILLALVACFAVLLLVYSWNYSSIEVFPWSDKRVVLMGHVLNPKDPDLAEQVANLSAGLKQEPIDAQYDSVNLAVIPDINGIEIDVEETVSRLKAAKNGENVIPAWKEVRGQETLADFANLPIYQGNPIKEKISFVINVSWGNEYLLEILDIFDAEEIQASFFLVGRWADENRELVKEIYSLGHEFGNHGYSDPHMKDLTPEAIKEEINLTNKVIQGLTGFQSKWFSPPYGEKVEKIYAAGAELGMHTVLWSLDTIDWTLPGEDVMVERIVDNLHNGAIILMHPTEQTPGALRRIIAGAREQGYQIVTVSELLDPSHWPQEYNSLWLGN